MAGFQNNPLTKFPVSIHPPGSSSRAVPGNQAAAVMHTPIGTVTHSQPTQLTPLGAKTKSFMGFKSPFNK